MFELQERVFHLKKCQSLSEKEKRREVKIQILKPRFSIRKFSWGAQVTVILRTSLQALAQLTRQHHDRTSMALRPFLFCSLSYPIPLTPHSTIRLHPSSVLYSRACVENWLCVKHSEGGEGFLRVGCEGSFS